MHDQPTRLLQLGGHKGNGPVLWAIVDAADFEWLSQWRWSHVRRYGYRHVMVNGRKTSLMLHRALLGLEHGDPRQGDHENRNRLDNRRSNLRILTGAENTENVPSRGGTSPHRGVSWCKRDALWLAQCHVRGRNHNLGRYGDEEEAARVAAEFRALHLPFSTE